MLHSSQFVTLLTIKSVIFPTISYNRQRGIQSPWANWSPGSEGFWINYILTLISGNLYFHFSKVLLLIWKNSIFFGNKPNFTQLRPIPSLCLFPTPAASFITSFSLYFFSYYQFVLSSTFQLSSKFATLPKFLLILPRPVHRLPGLHRGYQGPGARRSVSRPKLSFFNSEKDVNDEMVSCPDTAWPPALCPLLTPSPMLLSSTASWPTSSWSGPPALLPPLLLPQVCACASCTRWLLLPWLVIYLADVLLLLVLGILVIVVPVHQHNLTSLLGIDFQLYRCRLLDSILLSSSYLLLPPDALASSPSSWLSSCSLSGSSSGMEEAGVGQTECQKKKKGQNYDNWRKGKRMRGQER